MGYVYIYIMGYIMGLVGGFEHFYFSIIGNSNANWLIFSRGVETTNQLVNDY